MIDEATRMHATHCWPLRLTVPRMRWKIPAPMEQDRQRGQAGGEQELAVRERLLAEDRAQLGP